MKSTNVVAYWKAPRYVSADGVARLRLGPLQVVVRRWNCDERPAYRGWHFYWVRWH